MIFTFQFENPLKVKVTKQSIANAMLCNINKASQQNENVVC